MFPKDEIIKYKNTELLAFNRFKQDWKMYGHNYKNIIKIVF